MTSPSMEYSNDLPLHWTPPTPYVVTTIPDYFGGRPTPPPSPFWPRDALVFDDCTPCPPTPRFVPYDEEDGQESTTRVSETPSTPATGLPDDWYAEPIPLKPDTIAFQTWTLEPTLPARPPNDWRTPKPAHSTTSTNDTVHQSNDYAHHTRLPHVSDNLIYDFEIHACLCPVLMIIQRAILDQHGYQETPIDPSTCTEPSRLFSFTAGHPPKTGLDYYDQQTIEYYTKQYIPSLLPGHEFSHSYTYPISAIETVQEALLTQWTLVYPSPIPVLIIRLSDLVGYYCLRPRHDGYSFVLASVDLNSIWPIVCQRGVDADFRPLDYSRTVETDICHVGAAAYAPQHIVASKFAVNVFLETQFNPGQGYPRCEYLGAFILQTLRPDLPEHRVWEGVDSADRVAMYDRVNEFFCDGIPFLPMVQLLYYKWDRQILGLADEIVQSDLPQAICRDHAGYREHPEQHKFMSLLNFRVSNSA